MRDIVCNTGGDDDIIAGSGDSIRIPVAGGIPVTTIGIDPGHGGKKSTVLKLFPVQPSVASREASAKL